MNRVALLALLLTACATSRAVPPGQVPALQPNEGLVVMVVDSDTRLDALTFYNEAHADEFVVPHVEPGVSAFVFAARAGDYLLSNYRGPNAIFDAAAGGQRRLCVRIAPGVLASPGRFQFRSTGEGTGWVNYVNMAWVPSEADTARRLAEDWPELAKTYPPEGGACGKR